MKILLLSFLLSVSLFSFSQKKESWYDYNWKATTPEKARFYSTLQKTDSGWLKQDFYVSNKRLQMQALYEDEACKIQTGQYAYYHVNGVPSSMGKKIKGKKEGVCISYHFNGMMLDSASYRNGELADKRFRWHTDGTLSDSITKINDSTIVQVGWFEDGNLSHAGITRRGQSHGKWKFYHHNGKLSAITYFDNGNIVKNEYYDEQEQLLSDTSGVNKEATYKGGDNGWKKYLEKNLTWPSGLRFATPGTVTVVISFAIDEKGKVTDIETTLPFHPDFDNIALKLIKNSRDWEPAIVNNRRVKAWRRQPITFSQPE